jgi:hypothetical protein
MPDKDKVEALLKLADISWRDYSERRSIEWKINFGLWLALGVFAGFMLQHPTVSPHWWVKVAISVLLVFTFLVYTFLWKAEIKDRNLEDKAAAKHYQRLVETEFRIESPPPLRPPPPKGCGWPRTHLSQVLMTFLFLLLAVFAVWAPFL